MLLMTEYWSERDGVGQNMGGKTKRTYDSESAREREGVNVVWTNLTDNSEKTKSNIIIWSKSSYVDIGCETKAEKPFKILENDQFITIQLYFEVYFHLLCYTHTHTRTNHSTSLFVFYFSHTAAAICLQLKEPQLELCVRTSSVTAEINNIACLVRKKNRLAFVIAARCTINLLTKSNRK